MKRKKKNFNFLGRCVAYNPSEGNMTAFFIENHELFLIDCVENIFDRIMKNKILNGIDKVNLLITHTHSDHIVGPFILFVYSILNKKVNIILPHESKYFDIIKNILNNFNIESYMYKATYENAYDNKYKLFNKIRYQKTFYRCINDLNGIFLKPIIALFIIPEILQNWIH